MYKRQVQGIEKLVADNPDMTAVFVTNYEMTMGAVIGMNELGLKTVSYTHLQGIRNHRRQRRRMAYHPYIQLFSVVPLPLTDSH